MEEYKILLEEYRIFLELGILFVTILGWFYTNKKQNEMLEKQVQADRNKAHHGFVFPRKLKTLDKFMGWLMEGDQLFLKYYGIIIIMSGIDEFPDEEKGENIQKYEDLKKQFEPKGEEVIGKILKWGDEYNPNIMIIETMIEFKNTSIRSYLYEYYMTVIKLCLTKDNKVDEDILETHIANSKNIIEMVEEVIEKYGN